MTSLIPASSPLKTIDVNRAVDTLPSDTTQKGIRPLDKAPSTPNSPVANKSDKPSSTPTVDTTLDDDHPDYPETDDVQECNDRVDYVPRRPSCLPSRPITLGSDWMSESEREDDEYEYTGSGDDEYEDSDSESSDDNPATPNVAPLLLPGIRALVVPRHARNMAELDDDRPDDSEYESEAENSFVKFYDREDNDISEIVVPFRCTDISTDVNTYRSVREVHASVGNLLLGTWYGPDVKWKCPKWFAAIHKAGERHKMVVLPEHLLIADANVDLDTLLGNPDDDSKRLETLRTAQALANASVRRGNNQLISLPGQIEGHTMLRSYMADGNNEALPLDAALHFKDDFGHKIELLVPVPAQQIKVLCPAIGDVPVQLVDRRRIPMVEMSVPDVTTIQKFLEPLITGDTDQFFKDQMGFEWKPEYEDPRMIAVVFLEKSTHPPSDFDIFFALSELLRMNFTLRRLQVWDVALYERMDAMYRGWLVTLHAKRYRVVTVKLPSWSAIERLRDGEKDFDNWLERVIYRCSKDGWRIEDMETQLREMDF